MAKATKQSASEAKFRVNQRISYPRGRGTATGKIKSVADGFYTVINENTSNEQRVDVTKARAAEA